MLELQVIGNLGQDATIKEWNGRRYIAFSVGTNERYTDREGVTHERTTWVSCLKPIFNDNSSLANYLLRGTQVYVRGKVSSKAYQLKDGTYASSLNCNVSDLQLLSSKRTEETASNSQPASYGLPQPQQMAYSASRQSEPLAMPADYDDKLPF